MGWKSLDRYDLWVHLQAGIFSGDREKELEEARQQKLPQQALHMGVGI